MKHTKSFVLASVLAIVCALGLNKTLAADEPRTDGPEGSEYVKGETVLENYGWEVGLDVGTVFLHASKHSNYDTGIAFGGHVEYFIDDAFSLNFNTLYSYHSGSTGVNGMHNLCFDIGPRARLLYDPIAPFISISPGFVLQKFGAPVSDSVVSFAIDFGAGLDLLVHEHITMGMTYKFHLVFDRNTSTAGVGTADFQSLVLKIDYVF